MLLIVVPTNVGVGAVSKSPAILGDQSNSLNVKLPVAASRTNTCGIVDLLNLYGSKGPTVSLKIPKPKPVPLEVSNLT